MDQVEDAMQMIDEDMFITATTKKELKNKIKSQSKFKDYFKNKRIREW